MKRFLNKVVLVTGGTSGIGKATVLAFCAEGAFVYFCGRREQLGVSLVAQIENGGGLTRFLCGDVTNEEEVAAMLDTIIREKGRLDIAVNCAGMSPPRIRLVDCSEDLFNEVIKTNVAGTFHCMKHQIREMLKAGSGVVINIASILGLKAMDLKHALYTASKHAVVGLTKAAALEYAAYGVRVNVVCPGGVDTAIHEKNTGTPELKEAMAKLHPLKRLALPEEISQTILFLCSNEASFITGAAIPVDGGVMAS